MELTLDNAPEAPPVVQAPPAKIHFKGFNALRFYAALSVVVQHISYSPADWFGTSLLPVTLERLFLNGTDAVNLFFVLSGFLITYLLLAEHDRTGRVNIPNFYIRRAFRIYPVYFLCILVVLLVLHPPYKPELIFLLIFFMGNGAFVLLFPFPPLDHLWSIGVEEQYYLTAPILARYKRQLPKILMGIIAVWWIAGIIANLTPPTRLSAYILMSRYDLIALGALAACGHYYQWSVMRLFRHCLMLALAGIVIVYAIVFTVPTEEFFYTTAVGLAFVVLIYNVAARPTLPRILESERLEFLGNLSYSMYVYHPFFVLLFYSFFYKALAVELYQNLAYVIIIPLTIGVSWLSYKFWEMPFLRLKDRFKRA